MVSISRAHCNKVALLNAARKGVGSMQKTFFPVRVFGKLAETCEEVKKGAKVLVEGRLDISEYTGQEGQKRMTFRILADTYRLL